MKPDPGRPPLGVHLPAGLCQLSWICTALALLLSWHWKRQARRQHLGKHSNTQIPLVSADPPCHVKPKYSPASCAVLPHSLHADHSRTLRLSQERSQLGESCKAAGTINSCLINMTKILEIWKMTTLFCSWLFKSSSSVAASLMCH